ncbi:MULTISPECIES: RrF2 family transcriptional regulator [Halobacteriovorax]|nr:MULTISPECIES: Rrf2 family transcriptional regulator [Halobacteriovorax]AYF44267.1 transcriptional regulator [Halobacteriovorax sp. BALOs_7]
MYKVSKKTQYALTALKHMQEYGHTCEENLTSAREICDKYDMPFDPVSKVMQKLNNSGILSSIKGIKGGYFLSRPLSNLNLFEVSNIIEGKVKETACDALKGKCDKYLACELISPIEKINSHVNHHLISVSLEELLMNKTGVTHE